MIYMLWTNVFKKCIYTKTTLAQAVLKYGTLLRMVILFKILAINIYMYLNMTFKNHFPYVVHYLRFINLFKLARPGR